MLAIVKVNFTISVAKWFLRICYLAMPRGTHLTAEERAIITTHKEYGLSNRLIATKIGRSVSVVCNFLNLGENYNTASRSGRPSLLTSRKKNIICHEARRNKLNARQIKQKLALPVGVRRVQQVLKANHNLRYTKMMKKPQLQQHHKEARLRFSRDHMAWTREWQSVIFSDEKKFNLDGPDGFSYYWRDLRDEKAVKMSRHSGGGSVMVWGAFGFLGKIPLMFVQPKMNGQKYREMLEYALDEFGDIPAGENFIFQQDNAPIHNASCVREWFEVSGIQCLSWPSCSPDLNPIENLWGIMARKIYTNGKQYSNVADLKRAITETWLEINEQVLQNLINSMPNRIFQVIENQGGCTKY